MFRGQYAKQDALSEAKHCGGTAIALPLYAALQHAVTAGWMPIETAPKDGSYLLLWEQYSKTPFVGFWSDGSWPVSHEHVDAEGGWDGPIVIDVTSMSITHWMPLPPAPSTEGESK